MMMKKKTTDNEKSVNFSELVGWTEKQKEAFRSIGTWKYILYGGARGGGKSYLAYTAAMAFATMYPGLRITVVRKTYMELRSFIIDEFIKKFDSDLFEYRYLESKHWARFKNGSLIRFVSMDKPQSKNKEKGVESHLLILDEGNELREDHITFLLGSLRNSHIKSWRPTLLITANPGGESDAYIKKYWNPQADGTMKPDYSKWSANQLEEKDYYKFIPAKLYDNPHLFENDPEYIRTLNSMPEEIRRRWVDGDWEVVEGKFFSEWDERIHIVREETHPVGQDWVRWGAVDLGDSSHESIYLEAAQDPETGQIIIYKEIATRGVWQEIARQIVSQSQENGKVNHPIYADRRMFQRNNVGEVVRSGLDVFNEAGLNIFRASDEREAGWINLKTWMQPHTFIRKGEVVTEPMIVIYPCCTVLAETIPQMKFSQVKPYDLNTRSRDDAVDAMRYITATVKPGYIFNGREQTKKILTEEDLEMAMLRRPIAQKRTGWEPDDYMYIEDDSFGEGTRIPIYSYFG